MDDRKAERQHPEAWLEAEADEAVEWAIVSESGMSEAMRERIAVLQQVMAAQGTERYSRVQ